jgi:hypothetical protein
MMNRRELLKNIALLSGSAMIGAEFFLTGCKAGGTSANFSASDVVLLNEVGETIIPATDIPGAKAAKVGEYMKVMVQDCYDNAHQKAFMNGIKELNVACKKMHGKQFMDCDANQRYDFLVSLEKLAKPFDEKVDKIDKPRREQHKKDDLIKAQIFEATPKHYYTMMKQLTIAGYFTSEIGMTQAMQYNPIPQRYDGAEKYVKGSKCYSS